ncbi:MAG: tRNA guanosine(34) transglycosylase Tgt [Thermoanaerobaculia bacterium]
MIRRLDSSAGFQILARDGAARRGRLSTPHGVVDTPAFMPVGTLGAVKGVGPEALEEAGAQILLANLYHLGLRPGVGTIQDLGGIHAFTGWRRPLLTDSGGFQVFSLASLRRVDDGGVTFRSHVDGALVRLTPETVVEDQGRLGVDIGMVLDECPPWPAERDAVAAAVERTARWARISRGAWDGSPPALFGIVQGGVHLDLRERSASDLAALDFPGYAIGGVSVGEPPAERRRIVEQVVPMLPEDRPRYLMGVGTLRDIQHAVAAGVDLFDCVLPSRNARHGRAFTRNGELQLTNARFRDDPRPLAEGCDCPACRRVSRALLHHLSRTGELTAKVLLTLHNLRVYLDFMRELGEAIGSGSLAAFSAAWEAE